MNFYFLFSIILILDLATALFARASFNFDNNYFLLGSILSVSLAGLTFIKLLKFNITAIVNALWISAGTILIAFASYFLFGEKISLVQGLGMVIMTIGMIAVGAENPVTESE